LLPVQHHPRNGVPHSGLPRLAEAVKTYSSCIRQIDDGTLAEWAVTPAPPIAIQYWRLPPGATMRDLLLVIRADEAAHRDVNHAFADIGPDAANPFT
jgi:ubiquinol oxidase